MVPDAPCEETAASRGPVPTGHGISSVGTNSRPPSGSIRSFHPVKWRFAGTWPWRTASTALISPAIPAAASQCPRFVLTDPRAQPSAPVPYEARSAAYSTGSPDGVPAPCASTSPTRAGSTPALASTSSCSRRWPSSEGPVIVPDPLPWWLTPLPRSTAITRSPSAIASGRRFSATMPQPSPDTMPSASEPKALHRPVGDSMPIVVDVKALSGVRSSVTPPASARSTSPVRSAWQPRWTATSDEEPELSSVTAGPRSPSR